MSPLWALVSLEASARRLLGSSLALTFELLEIEICLLVTINLVCLLELPRAWPRGTVITSPSHARRQLPCLACSLHSTWRDSMGQKLRSQGLRRGGLESDSGCCHLPEPQQPLCIKGLIAPTWKGRIGE